MPTKPARKRAPAAPPHGLYQFDKFGKPVPAKFDGAGIHNDHLEDSTLRIIRGGSWKRQDIVVLIPAAMQIPAKCLMSWWNLIFPPNNGAAKILIQGMEVGDAYSTAIDQILQHPTLGKFKFVLTIEHDNVPPPDGVLKLVEQMELHPDFGGISGLYWTKGVGGVPQIWGDVRDPVPNYRPQPPDPGGGLVECYGTGMGFALWRMEMFRDTKLRRPWFRTLASMEEGVGTQDLYFAADARKFGYRFGVACNVPVGHYDLNSDTTW